MDVAVGADDFTFRPIHVEGDGGTAGTDEDVESVSGVVDHDFVGGGWVDNFGEAVLFEGEGGIGNFNGRGHDEVGDVLPCQAPAELDFQFAAVPEGDVDVGVGDSEGGIEGGLHFSFGGSKLDAGGGVGGGVVSEGEGEAAGAGIGLDGDGLLLGDGGFAFGEVVRQGFGALEVGEMAGDGLDLLVGRVGKEGDDVVGVHAVGGSGVVRDADIPGGNPGQTFECGLDIGGHRGRIGTINNVPSVLPFQFYIKGSTGFCTVGAGGYGQCS